MNRLNGRQLTSAPVKATGKQMIRESGKGNTAQLICACAFEGDYETEKTEKE